MQRLALVLALLAPVAARAGEGVYITLDGGYSVWDKKAFKSRLAPQVGNDLTSGLSNTDLLLEKQLPDGGIFGLHLGYNIAGHVAFEGNLMLRPYDLLADTRGSVGLFGMTARWFPLQGLVRPNRQFDFSLLAGIDYVLSGGNGVHGDPTKGQDPNVRLDNTGRGFDGIAVELGGTAELYPVKWVSLGLTPRVFVIDPIRYIVNWDKRDQGGAIPLSGKGTATLYSLSFAVTFHFEPLPD